MFEVIFLKPDQVDLVKESGVGWPSLVSSKIKDVFTTSFCREVRVQTDALLERGNPLDLAGLNQKGHSTSYSSGYYPDTEELCKEVRNSPWVVWCPTPELMIITLAGQEDIPVTLTNSMSQHNYRSVVIAMAGVGMPLREIVTTHSFIKAA